MTNHYGMECPYFLTHYGVGKELVEHCNNVTYKAVGPGAGHPGEGYDKGWISGGIEVARAPDWYVYSPLQEAVHELQRRLAGWEVAQVLINRMAPHTILEPHRDSATGHYRFHLPVTTQQGVMWWDEIQDRAWHFAPHAWYGPVPYAGVLHSMSNGSDQPRIHVVVDMAAPK